MPKLPTIRQINEALLQVQADEGDTCIMMHPRVLNWLGEAYKKEMIRMTNAEKGVNFLIGEWNGIPMVSSYQFMAGDEPQVVLD